MAMKSGDEHCRLVINLPEDVAQRLKLAAVKQNRAASDVVADLLDKCLPDLEARETKKKNIPYT